MTEAMRKAVEAAEPHIRWIAGDPTTRMAEGAERALAAALRVVLADPAEADTAEIARFEYDGDNAKPARSAGEPEQWVAFRRKTHRVVRASLAALRRDLGMDGGES